MTNFTKETTVTRVNTPLFQEPQAHGEAPQKVYDTKKNIIRINQIVWYVLGLTEVLLLFRLALKALGANPAAGFTGLIYSITNPMVAPFKGIFGTIISGSNVIEWTTLIAGAVYVCVAWGLIYLMELIYPISPKDVEIQ